MAVSLFATSAPACGSDGVDFQKDVLPLLQQRCFRCHEGREAKSGVRLDVRSQLLENAERGPLVIPGRSGDSRLYEVTSGADPALRMPPRGEQALKPAEVALLKRWIDAGLTWDADLLPEDTAVERHWAFQPVRRPAVPVVDGEPWSRTPLDRFITAKHRSRGLSPASEASRRVLIRRLSFDLLGLSPTWAEVQTFVADERPDAIERLIDRLLADPRYGEHWGRHWLDVARWAESEGFESNHPRPFAWRYRDYVVRAFNDDKPFDRFLTQQIAGDELSPYSDENLIATGYLAAARISSNEEDKALQKNDVVVDIVNAVGSGLLGLTVHCAQCHDHKFDPLLTREYYALHAFFSRGVPVNVALSDEEHLAEDESLRRPEHEQAVALQQTLFEQARQRLYTEIRASLTPDERRVHDLPADERTRAEELQARKVNFKFQKGTGEIERRIDPASRRLYEELKKRIAELAPQAPPVPQTFAFYSPVFGHRLTVLPSLGFYPLPFEPEALERHRDYVLVRGDVHQLGEVVQPAYPAFVKGPDPEAFPGTRWNLAVWLTDRRQPLVPRVWVNRIWQHHVGRGLVVTADDFGLRGARPSHPELLDWLTSEFLDHGWSTKHVHRLILTSAVYRQSAVASADAFARDSDNCWLTRHVPKRLTAEALRDAWLAATGELNPQMLGPSVPIEQRETSSRRSLYLFQRRGQAPEMQRLFDGPQECSASVARREVTTSPLQSLYLLNSSFAVARSRALAKPLQALNRDRGETLREAFRRTLLREPDEAELSAALELWSASPESPLESVCQALLNLNEFQYVE